MLKERVQWETLYLPPPECVVLFCFLCVSTVRSLMATLNGFPFNSGFVSHTKGNSMSLGHSVAPSLLMSRSSAIAATRAEQRKLTKKQFVLQLLGWKPNLCISDKKSKASVFLCMCVSGYIVWAKDRSARDLMNAGRNTSEGHWARLLMKGWMCPCKDVTVCNTLIQSQLLAAHQADKSIQALQSN